MFTSRADFEMRARSYEASTAWPRPVALIVSEFAASGEPHVLVDALERCIDHLMLAELAVVTPAARREILDTRTGGPLMWGRKMKLLQEFLASRAPHVFDVWLDKELWEPLRVAFQGVGGWFARGEAACLQALWPVVQVRNDHIHRRGVHFVDADALLTTLIKLAPAMARARVAFVQSCAPDDGSSFSIEYLDYNQGTSAPRLVREQTEAARKPGWSIRLSPADGPPVWKTVPWIVPSAGRTPTWRFDYDIDMLKGESPCGRR